MEWDEVRTGGKKVGITCRQIFQVILLRNVVIAVRGSGANRFDESR